MPLPQRLPGSELRRHIPPRRTRTEPPCNRFQHLAVITPPPPPAALIRGQHRLDQLPQLVGDHTSSDHSPIIGVVDRNLWETRPSQVPAPTFVGLSGRLDAGKRHGVDIYDVVLYVVAGAT